MFDTLTGRLDGIFKKLRSRGKLHPKQVDNALVEMRTALLEADVALEVADDLLERVRSRALSDEVMKSITPAQQVIKIVRDELQATMGGTQTAFRLPGTKPGIVMMAGVQGSGKTTACAKLAKLLKSKGDRPLLVAADLAVLFDLIGRTSTPALVTALPIALWEFSLGVWLVVRGFNPSAITALYSRTAGVDNGSLAPVAAAR